MKPLRAIRLVLLLTCRDAAPLLSRAIDQALAASERAALRVHLWICPSCRRYRGQLDLIRRVVSSYGVNTLEVGLKPLPEDAKARVRLELARRDGTI
jgi:hypothetical protein